MQSGTKCHIVKSFIFGAGCAGVIPKAYTGTSSGELQCNLRRRWNFLEVVLYAGTIIRDVFTDHRIVNIDIQGFQHTEPAAYT